MIKEMIVFMAVASLVFGLYVMQMLPMWGAFAIIILFSLLIIRKVILMTD